MKEYWASYAIDRKKDILGLRGSLIYESNHSSVKSFILLNTEEIHGTK